MTKYDRDYKNEGHVTWYSGPPAEVQLEEKPSIFRRVLSFFKGSEDTWSCRLCHSNRDSGWPLLFPSDRDPSICNLCNADILTEVDRRVDLARNFVGQIMAQTGKSTSTAWQEAIRLANDDPFRFKNFDDEVQYAIIQRMG